MSVEKAKIKMGTAHEIGCRLDDALEAAKAEVKGLEGAVMAFSKASKEVDALKAHVDKDIDEGKFDLDTAKQIKLYISRAADACLGLSRNTENRRLMAAGKVQAMAAAVETTKKVHNSEQSKLNAIVEEQANVKAGRTISLRTGAHPGPNLKVARTVEEKPEVKSAPKKAGKKTKRSSKGNGVARASNPR